METAPDHFIELTPDPYPHFTLKECLEQPEAIARSMSYGARIDANKNRVVLGGLDKNAETLASVYESI